MQTLKRIAAAAATLLLLSARTRPCLAALSCSSDDECSSILRDGSFCVDGFCSNPFVQGCLKTIRNDADPNNNMLRACNSDDKKAGNTEACIDYDDSFNYAEIRIHNGDWESTIFFAWIMQIVLMEVLHVPATVGLTSEVTATSSFYSPHNTLEYSSKSYGWEALRDAGACEETDKECVHVLPEVWGGQIHEWTRASDEGFIRPVEGNGQVGKMSWSIPSFMLENDSTLASYYGLRGEENRQKLAEAFLQPTTWEEYCEEVSTNMCSAPDGTSQRYPEESEKAKYFDASGYTGHFRATSENNCTAFPDTCVGHFIAPPCRWSTNVDAQLYWNDIKLLPTGPLLNGGYEYSSMLEIWRAANATKSNVIMWWWNPETLNEEFYNTDAALEPVMLPRATHACQLARTDAAARCSEDIMERRGSPLGACDQEAHSLRKIISERFVVNSRTASEARKSPAAEFVKNIEISTLDMDRLLGAWAQRKVDPYGNDAREAVCAWVDDNLDSIMQFVPEGYPRSISNTSPYDTELMNAATALAFVTMGVVLIMSGLVYRWRKTRVFVYAQTHIIALIMFGFFLITTAAVLTSLQPTDAICIAQSWFVTLGYTVELVPLLVKVAAINKILLSAQKMKRVSISQQRMRRHVLMVVGIIMVIMIVWSVVDPALKVEEHVISDDDSTVVQTSVTCASNHEFWIVGSLGWQSILLLAAAVLAYQSRDIVFEFNESRSLGMMIYSHVVFLILRAIVYNLGQNDIFSANVVAGVTSTLLSVDTLTAIGIYLVPKCLSARQVLADDKMYHQSHESSIGDRPAAMKRMRSSRVVDEIETRAAAAKMAYLSTSNASNSNLMGSDAMHEHSGNLDAFRGRRESMQLRALKISQIKEMSCELEMEDRKQGSYGTEPGSSETTDTGGNADRTPRNSSSQLLPSTIHDHYEDEQNQQTPRARSNRTSMGGVSTDDNYSTEPDMNTDMYGGEDYLEKDLPSPPLRTRKRASIFSKRSSEGSPRVPKRSSVLGAPKRSSESASRRSSTAAPRRASLISLPKRASIAAPPGQEIYITQEVGPDGSQIFTPRMRPMRSSIAESVGRRISTDARHRREAYYESDESDAESNSEEHDDGGPRYTSAKLNQALDKAIRRTSAPDLGAWRNLKQRTKMLVDAKPNRHSSYFNNDLKGPEMLTKLEALDEASSTSLRDISSSMSLNDSNREKSSDPLDTTREKKEASPPDLRPPTFRSLSAEISNELEVLEEGECSSCSSND